MSGADTGILNKTSRLEQLLCLWECRFAIASVDDRTVSSNFARIHLLQWGVREFSFLSPLDMPVNRQLRLVFEMDIGSDIIRMTGRLIRKQSSCEGYFYHVGYELTPDGRSLLLSHIHRLLEVDWELASELYSMYSAPEPVPSVLNLLT